MNIKRLIALLIIIAVTVSMASCGNNTEKEVPEGMAYITNEAVDFGFCYPMEWSVDRNEGMISVKVANASGGESNASISVSAVTLKEQISAKEYWETLKTAFDGAFKELTVITADETKVADIPAYRVHYTAILTESVYHFVTVTVVYRGTAYKIVFTATEADYNTYSSAVDSVINNFEFK